MSKAINKSQICDIYAQFIRKIYKQANLEIPESSTRRSRPNGLPRP
jgi:hypothetical protein